MEKKKFIGTFHSIDTVLYKITEMTAQGYVESEIYAVTKAEDTISMLKGQTEAELLGVANGNWLSRFKLFLSGEEPILKAFESMGFSEQQSRDYYNEVKNGGVALFVEDRASNNQTTGQSPVEMDSRDERSVSGEQLDGLDSSQPDTVPRLNTNNL